MDVAWDIFAGAYKLNDGTSTALLTWKQTATLYVVVLYDPRRRALGVPRGGTSSRGRARTRRSRPPRWPRFWTPPNAA